MTPTAWDGHARVDYLPHLIRLQVTLFTVEPTVEAELRGGLRAAFVPDDPAGPPAFVGAVLERGLLPDDLRHLLGARLGDTADAVLAEPPRCRFVRLDLVEVDDLAETWAPYRAAVLASDADDASAPTALGGRTWTSTVGRWAEDLWTAISPGDLRAALSAVGGGDALRGHDDPFGEPVDGPVATGRWALPPVLADAAGIEPELGWAAQVDGLIEVTARPSGSSEAGAVWVSFDDGSQRWARMADDGAGRLTAGIATAVDPDRMPCVRVRTERVQP